VVGYYHADNPTARVGETEYGHDFAITEDRFLVDPWLFHYYGDSPVLDLDAPADRAEAVARYGPQEKWESLLELPEAATGFTAKVGGKRYIGRGR
jgi:hypothetical protein